MRVKRRIGIGFLMALTMWVGIGVASAQKLNMCESDWPPYEIVRGLGMLGQLENFEIFHEKYETCVFGIKKNKYDITFITLFEFIAGQMESPTNVVIAAIDYSTGGDNIVLRSEIKSASELKGKSIGLQTDTVSLQLF